MITEFLADNDSVLADEDGDFSDWIEIQNPTANPVSLNGWYLTDNAGDLTRWQFPNVSLDAGQYLTVFASDKNRSDAGGELHTDFKLGRSGEYLALVRDDGSTISYEFAPVFPEQVSDTSYGIAELFDSEVLIEPGAVVRAFAPTDASLGQTWIDPGFDDATWTAGTTGVGYDTQIPDYLNLVRTDDPLAYWRLAETGAAAVPMTNRAVPSDGFASGLGSAADSIEAIFGGAGSLRGETGLLSSDANLAARFDGIDDRVLIPDHDGFVNGANTTTRRTIELWFRPDAVPQPGSGQHQVLWEDGGTTNGFNVYLYEGEIYLGAWTSNQGQWVSAPVNSQTTYHAVLTYDSTADEQFAYLNGQPIAEQGSGALPGILPDQSDNAIGAMREDTRFEDGAALGDGAHFDGVIDEVAVYPHALSSRQIAKHYEAAAIATSLPKLIAYWPFDETIAGGARTPDATGIYDADIVGATLTTGVGGRTGEAMSFDGDNDYVNAGVISELVTPTSFTVAAWFRRDVDNSANATNHAVHNVLIGHSSGASNDNFELGTLGSSAEAYLHTQEKDGPGPSFSEPVGVLDGVWQHIALTYDADRPAELSLYFGGQLKGEFADWGGPLVSSATSPLTIGLARPGSLWGDFSGLIDDVAIWDSALSNEQVLALANGGSPLDITGFRSLIGADLQEELFEQGSSAYARVRFEVERAPADYDELTFQAKYDDGYVAYINGTEVARRNAADPLQYASVATAIRPNSEAVVYEQIDLSDHIGLLVEGTNVLAVQLLNVSDDDNDLLFLPELTAAIHQGADVRYFANPTPGGLNNESFAGFVAEPTFSAEAGFHDTAFDVEIATATPGAEIRFTTDSSTPTESNGTVYSGPVSIDTTTVLRAAAFKPGFHVSSIGTQTYVFRDHVIDQPANPPGFPSVWGPVPADYEMDPDITTVEPYSSALLDSLEALPTMSLVVDPIDMWDATTGIYANTQAAGAAWERAASIELFEFPGAADLQVDAGIRIQGSASRSTNRPKHNMRLIFRSEYGPAQLDFPLFGDTEVQLFDQIVLRGGNGDSWIHPTAQQRTDAQYNRDQWHRDAQVAMGQPTTAQSYAHLYINGLYWGLYHLIERPNAEFMVEHFGGVPEDYDVIRHKNETLDGDRVAWNTMMGLVRAGGLDDDANYQRVLDYIDPVNLADYMLLNFYSGNTDWDHNNWYGGRRREEGATWKFFSWDSERTFLSINHDMTGLDKANQPSEVHQALTANAEYKLLFADRIQRHMFGGGALTPENAAGLWNARADEILLPLVAESARWGDHHRPATPYTPDNEFTAHLSYLNTTYFPQRFNIVLNQLRTRGLYPLTEAPALSHYGGRVQRGLEVTLSAPAGAIYYTPDGSDPRLPGGAISPTALTYHSLPLTIDNDSTLKARVLNGGQWSALSEATYDVEFPSDGTLAITEVHYNPHDPTAAEIAAGFTDKDDFEYIELTNTGTEPINLAGVRFTRGIDCTFATSTLQPGAYVVVVKNINAFQTRYGTGIDVAGQFIASGLNNDDEFLGLEDAVGGTVHLFEYNDAGAWPGRADGRGASLEVIDVAGDYSDPDNWRSSEFGGSPGEPGGDRFVNVVINEVLTHTDIPQVDSIELYNTTGAKVDIGGWYLSDTWGSEFNPDNGNYKSFRIPGGTVIPAGDYLVFNESDFNSPGGDDPNDFALSGAHGDEIWLMQANAAGDLTRFADHVEFGAAANGESLGRWPNGDGDLYPMLTVTLDETNSGPRVGPLIVSEVMYHPAPPTPEELDIYPLLTADDLEFIEVFNPTNDPVSLDDWRIRGGIDFNFPDGITLAPGQARAVLSFNPDKKDEQNQPVNLERTNAFRSRYRLLSIIPLIGGYSGELDNGGERVQLQRPDEPPLEEPMFVPHLLEDQILYDDKIPWPAAPDGNGKSLTRVSPAEWGHSAFSWSGEDPTPGRHIEISDTLRVTGLIPTASGFVVQMNRPFDPAPLNLYDVEAGVHGPPDIALVGDAAGHVPGSLVIGADTIAFVATGGPLPADTYTVTVRSAANGLVDLEGRLLDGDKDGTAGGDFTQSFIAAPEPVTVSLPDFARGPGQSVHLPADGEGLPLMLSDDRQTGGDVKSVALTIAYNPSLLGITTATLGPDAPVDAVLNFDATTPGRIIVVFSSSTTPLPAGDSHFVTLTAAVPPSATYGDGHSIDISEIVVTNMADEPIAATADDALQTVVYFGDATGNASYSGLDAQRTARVGVGLDSGFEAHSRIDPVIVADITGNGAISGLDAQRIALAAVGLNAPEIPPIGQPLRLSQPRQPGFSILALTDPINTEDETKKSGLLSLAARTSGVGDYLQESPTPEVFLTQRHWGPIVDAVFTRRRVNHHLPVVPSRVSQDQADFKTIMAREFDHVRGQDRADDGDPSDEPLTPLSFRVLDVLGSAWGDDRNFPESGTV